MRHTGVIDKFCRVLKFIAESREPPRVRDVADGLSLSRATAYRLVSQFRDEGVLASNEDGGLELGPDFVRLVFSAASRTQLAEVFAGLMDAIAEHFQETAFLGRFDGATVALVDAATPKDEGRSHIYPGLGERPLHACSSSRAILAFLGDDEIDRLLPAHLPVLTDRTVVDRAAVMAELTATRARGYAICDEEIDEGITSVAVPIPRGVAGPTFSIGVVGPKKRIDACGIDAIGEELIVMVGRMGGGRAGALHAGSVMREAGF